jgi:hypothetical protein
MCQIPKIPNFLTKCEEREKARKEENNIFGGCVRFQKYQISNRMRRERERNGNTLSLFSFLPHSYNKLPNKKHNS